MILPWQKLPWQQDSDAQAYYSNQPQAQPQQGGNSLGDIIKYLSGANYNFQGANIKPQEQQVARLNNYSDAIANQDNPIFQQIYGQEKQSGQQDLARTIAELQMQNRKASMLGRTPLFSPERGGEQQFRALTQGYGDVQDKARSRARDIIGAGARATGNAFDAQNQLTGMQQANKKKKLTGIGNLADALPFLLKFAG